MGCYGWLEEIMLWMEIFLKEGIGGLVWWEERGEEKYVVDCTL